MFGIASLITTSTTVVVDVVLLKNLHILHFLTLLAPTSYIKHILPDTTTRSNRTNSPLRSSSSYLDQISPAWILSTNLESLLVDIGFLFLVRNKVCYWRYWKVNVCCLKKCLFKWFTFSFYVFRISDFSQFSRFSKKIVRSDLVWLANE